MALLLDFFLLRTRVLFLAAALLEAKSLNFAPWSPFPTAAASDPIEAICSLAAVSDPGAERMHSIPFTLTRKRASKSSITLGVVKFIESTVDGKANRHKANRQPPFNRDVILA